MVDETPVLVTRIIGILDEFLYLRNLKENWDGEGAVIPDILSISYAENFVCLLDEDFKFPETMLHDSGRVGLFWNDDSLFADLEFLSDGTIAYYIKKGMQIFKGVTPFDGVNIPEELNHLRFKESSITQKDIPRANVVERVRLAVSELP